MFGNSVQCLLQLLTFSKALQAPFARLNLMEPCKWAPAEAQKSSPGPSSQKPLHGPFLDLGVAAANQNKESEVRDFPGKESGMSAGTPSLRGFV